MATGPARAAPAASTGPAAETKPPTRTTVSSSGSPPDGGGLCHLVEVRPRCHGSEAHRPLHRVGAKVAGWQQAPSGRLRQPLGLWVSATRREAVTHDDRQ